jgi:hypothetical protein
MIPLPIKHTYILKSSWVISRFGILLETDFSEISMSIIRINPDDDVVNLRNISFYLNTDMTDRPRRF